MTSLTVVVLVDTDLIDPDPFQTPGFGRLASFFQKLE
jgi:hypothetical protein